MSYKLTSYVPNIKGLTLQKASIFLRLMAEEVVSISQPHTPKKEGYLRRGVLKQVLGLKGKVVWTTEYAAIMEKKQFTNYTTAGTGPHYAENAIEESKKSTAKIAKSSGLIL